jgi:hypothetical protein
VIAVTEKIINVGPTSELCLRVSVATLSRVVFSCPEDGIRLLALEHKATWERGDGESRVVVVAQPFGGAIRILNLEGFLAHAGRFNFDSERSRAEQDFRVYIQPSKWEAVREYCMHNLSLEDSPELESDPSRELQEEFDDTLGIQLEPDQYSVEPVKIAVENGPVPTANLRAPGQLTARIYRVYEVRIHDPSLWQMMMENNETHPEPVLRRQVLEEAQRSGRGRANAMFVAPIRELSEAYLRIPPEMRGERLPFKNSLLAGNVAAVLDDIFVPKFQEYR